MIKEMGLSVWQALQLSAAAICLSIRKPCSAPSAVGARLADPTFKKRLADLGGDPMPMTAAGFGKFIGEESEKWAKVVKFSGAKAD
jgi:hypothetical protein